MCKGREHDRTVEKRQMRKPHVQLSREKKKKEQTLNPRVVGGTEAVSGHKE